MTGSAIVVSGVGAVTPLGPDAATTLRGAVQGHSGLTARPADEHRPARLVAKVTALPPPPPRWKDLRQRWAGAGLLDRLLEILLGAATEAWEQAGVGPLDRDGPRVGLCVAGPCSPRGLVEAVERRLSAGEGLEARRAAVGPGDWARNRPSHGASVLAGFLGIRGPVRTSCMGAAGPAWAIAEARGLLLRGEADLVLCAAGDSLVDPVVVEAMASLGLPAPPREPLNSSCRPFSADRDGLAPGEGAAALVLESERHAAARGAAVLGRLLGLGRAFSGPEPDGGEAGARSAMGRARVDAGASGEQIGLVLPDGSGSVTADRAAARAVQRVFGAGGVAAPSIRGSLGHLGAATGMVESIVLLGCLRDGVLPPTASLRTPDGDWDLDHVPGSARPASDGLRVGLTHAAAFGGSHGCLVWAADEAAS